MVDKILGPNVRELLAYFIAIEAVPIGGGLAAGLNFLADPNLRRIGIEKAMTDMQTALNVVKAAPDNPYGSDEEAIARAILNHIQTKI